MDTKTDHLVLPGDLISSFTSEKIRLGPGLWQQEGSIFATKSGIFRCRTGEGKYWVENTQKRYVPSIDDIVIAIVTERNSQGWKLDIGCHRLATLSIYNFEGGTKKNRPNFPVGALVYARLCVSNKDVEPECTCIGPSGKAEGFGPLVDGYMFKCSTGLALQCLEPKSVILHELAKQIPFEIAVGLNGRIWVNAISTEHCILVANAIINSEFLNKHQIEIMVKRLLALVGDDIKDTKARSM